MGDWDRAQHHGLHYLVCCRPPPFSSSTHCPQPPRTAPLTAPSPSSSSTSMSSPFTSTAASPPATTFSRTDLHKGPAEFEPQRSRKAGEGGGEHARRQACMSDNKNVDYGTRSAAILPSRATYAGLGRCCNAGSYDESVIEDECHSLDELRSPLPLALPLALLSPPHLMSSEAEGTTRARRAREACSCASPICLIRASKSRSQEALRYTS